MLHARSSLRNYGMSNGGNNNRLSKVGQLLQLSW